MAKEKSVSRRWLTREQTDVTREAQYMTECAARREARVVTLGPLLLFSTEFGDAWLLDPAESFARCLAEGGEVSPSGIRETAETFAIEWNWTYAIDGDAMVFTDGSGSQRAVLGYPVRAIEQAADQMK